jgi:8-oxo-dGTP diphosphatase
MDDIIKQIYGNKIRIRVCGLCWVEEKLLMINHSGLSGANFWAPPGGGVEFSEGAKQSLVREFKEETGIDIEPGKFLFVCEFIRDPLHAIELFFEVHHKSGNIQLGNDPEMTGQKQLLKDVRWMSSDEVIAIPANSLHGCFRLCKTPQDLRNLKGYWSI